MLKLIKSQRLKNLIKNSGTLFVGSQFQTLLLFFQSIIVARSLGVSEYGKWAIVVTLCGLVMNFSTFRTSDVLGKYIVELRVKKEFSVLAVIIKKSLFVDFITRSGAIFLILLFSFSGSALFNGPESITIYLLYGFSLFFQFINATWFCLERDNLNYKIIAMLNFLIAFLRLVLIVYFFLVLKKINLIFLALSFLFSSGIIIIFKIIRIERLLKNYGQNSLKKIMIAKSDTIIKSYPVYKEFWQFMKTTYFSNIFSSMIKQMDILAVGYFFTSESVGLLRLAKNLSKIIQEFATNMAKPLYQDFNELIEIGKKSKILSFLKKNLKYYLIILFFTLLLISLFIKPFIVFVYGNEYIVASEIFRVYLILVFLFVGFFWVDPLLLALKGWEFKMKTLLVGLIFYILLIVVLSKLLNLYGIVISYILVVSFINIILYKYIKKNISIP